MKTYESSVSIDPEQSVQQAHQLEGSPSTAPDAPGHGQHGAESGTDGDRATAPRFDLPNKAWRQACMENASIPAGYTYLSQLLGHDLGNSVPANSVPSSKPQNPLLSPALGLYNLIENPFSLETVYGKGPVGTPHLYFQDTLRFRIKASSELTELFPLPLDDGPVAPNVIPSRLLADTRNRDTAMLHRLTVVWMQYHNLVSKKLVQQQVPGIRDDEHGKLRKSFLLNIYVQSRATVLETWHRVIMKDLLRVFCHPDVFEIPLNRLSTLKPLSTTDALHGLMRSFHALPLEDYQLNNSDRPLLKDIRNQLLEGKWGLDWQLFFGPTATNKTRMSASYTSQFSTGSAKTIALADLATSLKVGATTDIQALIAEAKILLPEAYHLDLSPNYLAALMNIAAGPNATSKIMAHELERAPLFLILMIEAQFFGESGGFGPLGSILLRRYLEHTKAQLVFSRPGLTINGWQPPQTMYEVIQTVQQHA